MDSEFNRPMTHQPEVLNIKSKEEIWRKELGIDGIVTACLMIDHYITVFVFTIDAEMASSTSSEDEGKKKGILFI